MKKRGLQQDQWGRKRKKEWQAGWGRRSNYWREALTSGRAQLPLSISQDQVSGHGIEADQLQVEG